MKRRRGPFEFPAPPNKRALKIKLYLFKLPYLRKYNEPLNLMCTPIFKILINKKILLANVMHVSGMVNLNFILHNNGYIQKSTQILVITVCSHTFTLFSSRKISVIVETFQLSFRMFVSAFHPEICSLFR